MSDYLNTQLISQYDIPVGQVRDEATRKQLRWDISKLSANLNEDLPGDVVDFGYAAEREIGDDVFRIIATGEDAAQRVERFLIQDGFIERLQQLGLQIAKAVVRR